jgi:4-coumarate--CoA ligase
MDNQSINDVAVIGVELKEEHTEAPRAYVVPAPHVKRDEAAAAEIVKWMDSKAAYYKKLRGGVRFVDEIPKSAAGKILRRVLKDMAKEEEKQNSGRAKL